MVYSDWTFQRKPTASLLYENFIYIYTYIYTDLGSNTKVFVFKSI